MHEDGQAYRVVLIALCKDGNSPIKKGVKQIMMLTDLILFFCTLSII